MDQDNCAMKFFLDKNEYTAAVCVQDGITMAPLADLFRNGRGQYIIELEWVMGKTPILMGQQYNKVGILNSTLYNPKIEGHLYYANVGECIYLHIQIKASEHQELGKTDGITTTVVEDCFEEEDECGLCGDLATAYCSNCGKDICKGCQIVDLCLDCNLDKNRCNGRDVDLSG